jgi:uncharacterized membrane protein YwaF
MCIKKLCMILQLFNSMTEKARVSSDITLYISMVSKLLFFVSTCVWQFMDDAVSCADNHPVHLDAVNGKLHERMTDVESSGCFAG